MDLSKAPYFMSKMFQSEMSAYSRKGLLSTSSQRKSAVTRTIAKMKRAGIRRDYTLPKKF